MKGNGFTIKSLSDKKYKYGKVDVRIDWLSDVVLSGLADQLGRQRSDVERVCLYIGIQELLCWKNNPKIKSWPIFFDCVATYMNCKPNRPRKTRNKKKRNY